MDIKHESNEIKIWKTLLTKILDFNNEPVELVRSTSFNLYLVLVKARPATLIQATDFTYLHNYNHLLDRIATYFPALKFVKLDGSTLISLNTYKSNIDEKRLGKILEFVCPGQAGLNSSYGIDINVWIKDKKLANLTAEKCRQWSDTQKEQKTEMMHRYESAIRKILPNSSLRMEVTRELNAKQVLSEILKYETTRDPKAFEMFKPSLINVLSNGDFHQTVQKIQALPVVDFTIIKILLAYMIHDPVSQFTPLSREEYEIYKNQISNWETSLYQILLE